MRYDSKQSVITGCATVVGAFSAALLAMLVSCGAAAQDQSRALTEAYNASGQQMFKQFSGVPGNFVFSPYSIGTAMAMALAGARGETERQMADVLKLRMGREQIADANAETLSILNGYESVKVVVADALMLTRRGAVVSKDYAALLKDKYATEVFQNASLKDVNDWVARKTQRKIDRILDRIEPDDVLVLLNAIYFKADWASKFRKEATRDEAFNLSPSRRVRVPMMNQRARYALVVRPGYRAIRMPYVANNIAMIVVLPDEVDGLPAVGEMLGAAELSDLLEVRGLRFPKPVELALPRFKIAFKADLKPSFKQAGMTLAFDADRGDFSGMTGRLVEPRLVVNQIAHRAIIEVQERGTEAAAATAVKGGKGTGISPEPETFRVDRPFLYYVVDDNTGAVLFQGRVVDPR